MYTRIKQFFPKHLTREMKELFLSYVFLDFANATMFIFEPVYLFTLGYSVFQIVLYYAITYLVYFFLSPVGGKIAKRYGFEHSMIASSFVLALYFLCVFLSVKDTAFLIIAALLLPIYKMLYWPSFYADFGIFGKNTSRARSISSFMAIDNVVFIIGPFLAGLVVTVFGFPFLYLLVIMFTLLSNLPFLGTKEKFEPSDFEYTSPFRAMFSKENRRKVLAYIGFGEEVIVLFVWPIFIYITVQSFVGLGSVTSLATVFMLITTLFIGKLSDQFPSARKKTLQIGTLLYAGVWLLRIFANSVLKIFLVDSASRLTKNTLAIPLYSQTINRAQSNHLVRDIVVFEMSLTLGKLLAASTVLVFLHFFPATWAGIWAIGAFFSLFYLLYRV